MSRRIDHFNDPAAPLANRVVPAASAVVVNTVGQVLLHRRTDNGLWSIPGGAMEPGESIAETVVREVLEETGVDVEPQAIVGIYSDPRHVVEYSDGEVRQQFSVCIACIPIGGELRPNAESLDVRYFAPDALSAVEMHPSIRRRLDDFLSGRKGVIA